MTSPSSRTADSGSTNSSLLVRVRANDAEAWQRLVYIYGPLVYRWCRQCRFQPADAADISQEVFRAVAVGIAGFRRLTPGDSFRGWLWTITRNKIRDHLRRVRKQPEAVGGENAQDRLDELAEPDSERSAEGAAPDDEHLLLQQTLTALRDEFEPTTWTAFWRITVDGRSAAEAAAELGLSVAAVRQAKYRVLRRLRRELEDLI